MKEDKIKIFGDLNIFSIIIKLDKEYCGEWLNGELCYIVNGCVIGKFSGGVSLRDAWSILIDITQKNQQRVNLELYKIDRETLFCLIDHALYGENFTTYDIYNIIGDAGCAYDYSILVNVESMLSWKIYSISDGNMSRIIYKGEKDTSVKEILVDTNMIENLLNDTFYYLDNLYKNETKKAGALRKTSETTLSENLE